MGNITKNFSYSEFGCKCGFSCTQASGRGINRSLVYKLQSLRELLGFPMFITSGCRCPSHNITVGGALASQHLPSMGCKAVDILMTSSVDRAKIVARALSLGLTVGINRSFVHLDDRPRQIIFLY